MKKIILTLALIAGATAAVEAQNAPATNETKQESTKKKPSPEERAKKGAAKAEKELGLNADQKAKWEAAALERMKANGPLHEKLKGSTTPEERKAIHAQAKANRDKFEATVNGFLTPEQKTKFDQLKETKKKEMKAKHKNGKSPEMHAIEDED